MLIKKILYWLLYLVGFFLIGLSLIFFIASSSGPSRLLTALALGAIGIGSFLGGSILKMSVQQNTPELIDADVIRLASKFDGKLKPDMLVSKLYITKGQALESLDRLSGNGSCRVEMGNDGVYYIFEGVKPKKMVRKCLYCGREQPIVQAITKCPYCGGEVKVVEKND
jgi:DNA-directed RNA polymerase subunit RPC12/RpoP